MRSSPAEPVHSLYVHVPFCAQKCSYCAFFSETPSGDLVNRYVRALCRELELVAPGLQPSTIFFGGGTPSLLNLRQWTEIFRSMDRLNLIGKSRAGASPAFPSFGNAAAPPAFPSPAPLEWTVECNPATVSLDKAKLLRDHGVNRISMGVQSLNADLLDRLGRVHTRDMVFKSFDTLRAAGFDNLSLDLMFAIPGQTLDHWRETLTEALALGSEHLSSYEVIYEDDTPLFHQLKAGQIDLDEDLACAMYEALLTQADRHGLHQYEIANFARHEPSGVTTSPPPIDDFAKAATTLSSPSPREERTGRGQGRGASHLPQSHSLVLDPTPSDLSSPPQIPNRACRHNINYWRGGSFHGLGPGASGYVNGIRTRNWSNTQLYCEQLEQGRRAIESSDQLPPRARAGEIAAFGLRMNAGWPFDQFRQTTGWDLRREWSREIDQLVQRGWAAADPQHLRLTPAGLRFADSAAQLFLG